MTNEQYDTDELLAHACQGDRGARDQLWERHRGRLKRMVTLRMDKRLNRRLDSSDVVQEALAEAARRLPEYSRARTMPFYPWLRQIAWERLIELHRRHFRKKRSVIREEPLDLQLSDESVCCLADRLAAPNANPSGSLVRKELANRVHAALDALDAADRETLMLRHIEQLSSAETAAILGISVSAAKSRHFRAMQRMLSVLDASAPGLGHG